jgi:signal transduction histidine kinase
MAVTKPGALKASDLAELIASFNEVTEKLERTHESLRLEVGRLQGELQEANEQLQRSRRLAALGEMAAGIAHEVRNPLGSIKLYARMLEQDLADRPGERGIAVKIGTAVRGLDAVVGDVLNFARELRAKPETIGAAELLERAVEAVAGTEPAGGARIVVSAGAAALWCDSILMHQAVVNIARNGLQAMSEAPPPPGGHTLTLSAGARAGECCITVSDTGPGVGDDAIDRMFNPFFTTRRTGTGLGLAIVHRIVDAHGGRVSVRRNGQGPGGGGAVFELSWPAKSGVENRAKPRRQDGARRARQEPAAGTPAEQEAKA